ncbi:MAG: hypothetical protein GF398_20620 [Chitinivibrionales bacterium]|nr:hypothetical protein [Chitinivibrionales bacterium]
MNPVYMATPGASKIRCPFCQSWLICSLGSIGQGS